MKVKPIKREGKLAAPVISEQLRTWQDRLAYADREFADEVVKMDERDKLYNGSNELRPLVSTDRMNKKDKATHVRNIIFENIESQINSSIPQPKVTPKRKQDERLAEIIENFIRNELNRLPFETMNDLQERTVPIQGGGLFFQEWDNRKRTHTTVGAQQTSLVHPKQLAPQPGIYTDIEDMDWVILKIPTTKETVRRKYGINVADEGESEPEIRGTGNEDHSTDAVTQYIGFARNDSGGIDKYSWVNNTELEDIKNYQARRLPTCKQCGRVQPLIGQYVSGGFERPREDVNNETASAFEQEEKIQETEPEIRYDGGACPWCGCKEWEQREQDYETIVVPIETQMGKMIPGEHLQMDEMGNPMALVPTKIPYYRPDIYPIVLQRNVSQYGKLLGNSDVDAIRDQQNTTNRIEKKIIDRLLKAGTRVTLPPKGTLRMDPEDVERWYLSNPADKAMIGVYQFTGDLQYELAYLSQVYEEARQILGITNSFQGREDPTATSGVAKEFSANMSAGRLESKRTMKNAAYAKLFEIFFKFQLAYADEPRPVTYKNFKGETQYTEFNRYDFLEQDDSGEWYWNDQFLFSCDTSAPLANNREAMWQETRMNLQTGAFGDPASTETLILFWGKMEMLHYPGANETKQYLEERLQREQEQAARMQQMQMAMQAQQMQAQQLQSPQSQTSGNPNPLSAAPVAGI